METFAAVSSHQDCPEQAIARLLGEPPRPEHTSSSAFRTVAALSGARLDPLRVHWLLDTQHRDGSWGGAISFAPDRCLNTLAAVVALAEYGRTESEPEVVPAIHAGVAHLWNALTTVRVEDPRRPANFAEHLTALLHRARNLNLALPYPNLDDLALPPEPPPLAPGAATVCEATAEELDTLWTALTLARSGVPGARLAPFVAELAGPGKTGPVPAAFAVGSGDGEGGWVEGEDDGQDAEAERAAILCAVRRYSGLGADEGVLEALVGSGASPIHVLGALTAGLGSARAADEAGGSRAALDKAGARGGAIASRAADGVRVSRAADGVGVSRVALAGMLERLRDCRSGGAFWQHRWHLSPYHATWLALGALAELGEAAQGDTMREDAISWLMSTQRADGSWGVGGGTAEETAYAVNSLLTAAPDSLVVRQSVAMGMDYLEARRNGPWPELWLGAVLFTPRRVVRAAVLGTFHRYRGWLAQRGDEPRCTVSPASQ